MLAAFPDNFLDSLFLAEGFDLADELDLKTVLFCYPFGLTDVK